MRRIIQFLCRITGGNIDISGSIDVDNVVEVEGSADVNNTIQYM